MNISPTTQPFTLKKANSFADITFSNALLRLIYHAFKEGIWPLNTLFFQITDEKEGIYLLRTEYDVLEVIYLNCLFQNYSFSYTFNIKEKYISISDIDSFFQQLVIPYLPSQDRRTLAAFIQKVKDSMKTEEKMLHNRILFGNTFNHTTHINLWHWITTHQEKVEDSFILMQFSSLLGNPTHPLTKLRNGFTEEELMAFSPEYGEIIDVPVLAVSTSLCTVSMQHTTLAVREWFSQAYPQVYRLWEKKLEANSLNPEGFYPIPIHPYQLRYLPILFSEFLENTLMVEVEGVTIPAKASMSTRTLMPLREKSPYIKLPLDIQTTSMRRTHSPPRVHAGPVLSALLEDILQKDPFLHEVLRILPEPLGIYLDDSAYYHQSQNPSYFLNVLYRTPPSSLIATDEWYLPLSAIFGDSPFSGKPLLLDI
ncbi:MAG: IucA/IucC family protein, partial [Bacteroidota bacterium]